MSLSEKKNQAGDNFSKTPLLEATVSPPRPPLSDRDRGELILVFAAGDIPSVTSAAVKETEEKQRSHIYKGRSAAGGLIDQGAIKGVAFKSLHGGGTAAGSAGAQPINISST